jgi:uncharacterized membrane protein
MQQIRPSELINQGWQSFKQHWKLLLGALVLIWLAGVVLELIGVALESVPLLAFLMLLVSIAVSIILQIGLTQISLDLAYERPASIRQLIGDHTIALRYFGASIMYALIVAGGLILLIVPGIIWSIKYSQFRYLIVDKKVDAFESLSQSARLTDGHKMQLFWLWLLVILINLVGALAFMVGLLISIPVTVMVMAYTYKQLTAQKEGLTVPTPPTESEHAADETFARDAEAEEDPVEDATKGEITEEPKENQ